MGTTHREIKGKMYESAAGLLNSLTMSDDAAVFLCCFTVLSVCIFVYIWEKTRALDRISTRLVSRDKVPWEYSYCKLFYIVNSTNATFECCWYVRAKGAIPLAVSLRCGNFIEKTQRGRRKINFHDLNVPNAHVSEAVGSYLFSGAFFVN